MKICCISGGGVKGIIPIKLFNEYNVKNDYDVYIGTSVGSIVCACLALGMNTKRLEYDFPNVIEKIFGKKKNIGNPKYSLNNAIMVLNEYFKYATCGDLHKRFVIASVDLVGDLTYYLKSDDYPQMLLAEFVARSFCAPSYFENIPDGKETMIVWSDGGVGYHNFPVMPAIGETFGINGLHQIHAFGTGFTNKTSKEIAREYDLLVKRRWIKDVFEFISLKSGGFARKSSGCEQVNAGKRWANKTNNSFIYFDAILEKDIALDDYKAVQNGFAYTPVREETGVYDFESV